jgi:hypothetical protein
MSHQAKGFKVSPEDAKAFPKFLKWLVTSQSAKARKLRATLREESVPEAGGRREKSETLLDDHLHTTFPSMQGCLTDITCIRYLFQAALEEFPDEVDTDDVTDMMGHINELLPMQYPTESQLDSYHVQVQAYRKILVKLYGRPFVSEYGHKLQYAGGSESRTDAMQYKLARAERQSKALSQRVTHKIPATQSRILKAIFTCAMLLTTVDAFVFAMIMMGSRKSEVINPEVADFDHEKSEREGYIVQWGTAKERGYKADSALVSGDESEGDSDIEPPSDYKGPPGFYLRRRVEKPILQVSSAKKIDIDDPANVYSVKDVQTAIHKVRDDWGIKEMLDAGYTPGQVARQGDLQAHPRVIPGVRGLRGCSPHQRLELTLSPQALRALRLPHARCCGRVHVCWVGFEVPRMEALVRTSDLDLLLRRRDHHDSTGSRATWRRTEGCAGSCAGVQG